MEILFQGSPGAPYLRPPGKKNFSAGIIEQAYTGSGVYAGWKTIFGFLAFCIGFFMRFDDNSVI